MQGMSETNPNKKIYLKYVQKLFFLTCVYLRPPKPSQADVGIITPIEGTQLKASKTQRIFLIKN